MLTAEEELAINIQAILMWSNHHKTNFSRIVVYGSNTRGTQTENKGEETQGETTTTRKEEETKTI